MFGKLQKNKNDALFHSYFVQSYPKYCTSLMDML